MPNVSKHTQDSWLESEKAAIAGVGYKEISERWGIPEAALRKRASEYHWAVPRRIDKLVKEHKSGILTNPHRGVKQDSTSLTAESVAEQGAAYRLKVFQRTRQLAEKALDVLPVPDNWKSFDTADRIIGRAAGLDRPDVANVSVNLAMFASTPQKSWRRVEDV